MTAKDLQPLFADLGFRLGNEYLILYRSLAKANRDVKVAVSVAGYPSQTLSYRTPADRWRARSSSPRSGIESCRSPITLVAIVLGIVGLLWYAVSHLLSLRRGSFRRRMGSFVQMGDDEDDVTRAARRHQDDDAGRRPIVPPKAHSALVQRGLRARRHRNVAGVPRAPRHRRRHPARVFLAVVFGSGWLVLFGLLVPWGVRWYVSHRVERKRRRFGDDLPDNLDVLAQSLRAGHSLVGAINVVSETATEPTKSEFARIVSDEQLGVPLDDALTACVQRMNNRDLDQVAVVALIQRDAGGNAAEVIDQVAFNVRVRQELRRLARTLTSQGRMARWILTALPIGLFILLFLINKEYLSPLWETTYGIMALIVSAIMVTIGSIIIKHIVEIKV